MQANNVKQQKRTKGVLIENKVELEFVMHIFRTISGRLREQKEKQGLKREDIDRLIIKAKHISPRELLYCALAVLRTSQTYFG